MYANGRYPFTRYDTTLVRTNSDIRALRTEATLYGYTPRGEWKAQIYNYNSERGLPGYIARNLFEHFLAGELTPVFFGSAINNFGIQEILNSLILRDRKSVV